MDYQSERRLVENEVIVKKLNERLKKTVKTLLETTDSDEVELLFNCECSDLQCDARIKIGLKTYENIHKRKDYFTLTRGHEIPEIEDVVERNEDYIIVQKLLKPISA
jgi:hypothetical protein